MAQITTTDANEFSSSAEFTPMRGFSNCHLQTMLPRLFRRQVKFTPYWQRLELPDGDFVDLAWSEDPAQAKHKPRLVVFHGLQREFGHAPTAAVGYSLGGNMLACLLAKEGNDLPVDAAVIVSAPFMLEACSYHMEKGFSRVYQRYLLNLLKANAARKLAAYPGTLPINLAQLKSVRRIREFDDLITARIHGYADAIDYYRQCSAMPMLNRIAKPTLIIHAKDDPFMDHQVIPKPESLPPQVEYQLTEHGGHVGFIGGTLLHPQMWLESRIPDWLTTYLEAKSC
ncbi:hydrolase [Escherichia coli]